MKMNTNIPSQLPSNVFIRGIGAAIPGIGDDRLEKGTADGGLLLHTADICGQLETKYKIHNPKTGKPMDREWARRNFGMETLAVGNVAGIKTMIKGYAVETKINDDAQIITENELAFVAFDEALERASLSASDIDVILRVSPTLSDVYFWAGLCEWKERYPELKEDVTLQQHPLGCPAFMIELDLAQTLLSAPHIKNVAIVISSCGSARCDTEFVDLHAHDNNIRKWTNLLLFGDGASACIVSTSETNLPEMVFDLVDVKHRTDYSTWVSRREDCACLKNNNPEVEHADKSSTRPLFWLNIEGPKHMKGALDHWVKYLKKNHSFSFGKADHVALHSPNPKVLNRIAKHFGVSNKISQLPEKVGNLGPASCVTNLHERLYGLDRKSNNASDGDIILGFALGDSIGLTDGVFLLKARSVAPESLSPGQAVSIKKKKQEKFSRFFARPLFKRKIIPGTEH